MMRVAVASDDKSSISYNFSNARGFMIYDVVNGKIQNKFYQSLSTSENRKVKVRKNKACKNLHRLFEAVFDCSAIISYAIGGELYRSLKNEGIEIYQTVEADLDSAINLLMQGGLKPLK